MSQEDVLDILRAHPGEWLNTRQIKAELKAAGKSNGVILGVTNDVYKLASYGIIRVKGIGLWKHEKRFSMP